MTTTYDDDDDEKFREIFFHAYLMPFNEAVKCGFAFFAVFYEYFFFYSFSLFTNMLFFLGHEENK